MLSYGLHAMLNCHANALLFTCARTSAEVPAFVTLGTDRLSGQQLVRTVSLQLASISHVAKRGSPLLSIPATVLFPGPRAESRCRWRILCSLFL